MQKIKIVKTFVACFVLVFSFASNAGLIKNSSGLIIGFDGVDFGGKTYNVNFDGRACLEIFDGCDSTDDFFFQDVTTAVAASAALAETMFNAMVVDSFVNNRISVQSILGCTIFCDLLTPYEDRQTIVNAQFGIYVASANLQSGNSSIPSSFGTGGNAGLFAGFDFNYTPDAEDMWVVWEEAAPATNPVPEPSTLVILGLGLIGLGLRRKNRV